MVQSSRKSLAERLRQLREDLIRLKSLAKQRCKLFNITSFNVARIKCACDSHNLWPVRAVFKAVCVLQLIKCFKLLAFTASKPEFSSWSTFSYNLWNTVFPYSSQVQHGLQTCLYMYLSLYFKQDSSVLWTVGFCESL